MTTTPAGPHGSPPSSTTAYQSRTASTTNASAGVMRENGIAGYRRRRRVRTTIPEPADHKVPDLVKRDFTAPAPNQRYVGDITYLPLSDGENLYLATVIDCYSGRIVGWAVADHMRTELVEDALPAAQTIRGSLAGAISTATTARPMKLVHAAASLACTGIAGC